MRLLAIGDIHGCFRALTTLEEYVPLTAADRIVTIGDYVDRGPNSRAVLEWLIARQLRGNLVALRGNHELMMCAARQTQRHYDEWLACGGDAALASYSRFGGNGRLVDVPQPHWHFMEHRCRPYFESEKHFFVHANAYANMSVSEQPDYMLYWEQFNDPPPHESGKIMICGHTPQRDGLPRNLGHAVCIDTWAHGSGWLTCLDVESGQYWQAAEDGRTRRSALEPPK